MSKLVLLGALALSTSAAADNYDRKANSKIDVKQTERSKPRTPKTPDAKEPAVRAPDILGVELGKSTYRAGMADVLIQIIDNTPDTNVNDKADAYFRLAELYALEHRAHRLSSVEQSIKGNKAKADELAATARSYLIKSVTAYRALTDNDAFQNWAKMDVALFYYGYTLQSGTYMKEARSVFDKLLRNYPQSKYVAAAHLAFADYYFEAGQLSDAEARYKRVLKFPKSPSYWYAMYKLGFIQLNSRNFLEALDTFSQVAMATQNDPKSEILHRAAKKDFVRAYAEIGKADKAYLSFQRIDSMRALEMLETLADTYMSQGKSDKAIYTLHELMKLAPTHGHVCVWQHDIATAMLTLPGASVGDKVKEIENLVRLWGALRSSKLTKAEKQECHDNAAAMSGEIARQYHSEAARTKNPETLGFAERLYRVYLDGFPDASDYAQTAMYYADLSWTRAEAETNERLKPERWEQAALAFTEILQKVKLDAAQTKDAAYAAALGYMRALQMDPRPQSVQMPDADADYATVPAPVPVPAREQKLIEAFGLYLRYVQDKNDEERIGMMFMIGNTLRRYHQYDKAIPIFEELLADHRAHEIAEPAANLLLDIYNRKHDFTAMLALASKLRRDKAFMDGKADLEARLRDLEITSVRKRAEEKEKQARATKDFAAFIACGQAYLDAYNLDPENKKNDEVLYSAGVCFQDGRSITAAITAFNSLRRYYPASKLSARALARIGKAYGDIAYYEESAAALEEYAKRYAGEGDAYDAMNDVVFYQKGLGNDAKAIANTRYFVATFGAKRPQEAANASYALASVYEKQGDTDALVKHLREYIRTFGERGGNDRLLIAYAKIGQALWTQSCPVRLVDGSCVKVRRERAIKLKLGRGAATQQKQCGDDSKIKLTVVARDERKVRDAMQAFAAAARVFETTQGKTGGDEAGARYWYGLAKLAEADKDFEAYLAVTFPQNLDFDPRSPATAAKSMQRFNTWVAHKNKLGGSASSKYERVLTLKDAASSITAAARLGQVSQNFSDALYTAEIPNDLRTGPFAEDKVEAFCSKLEEIAGPLEARSLAAYRVCLHKSTELGWFSDWSKLCERELGQIKPEDYPTAAELRAQPTKVSSVIALEPPVQRLE
ncbi:MAG: tetratricopeptide repeat protein [Kofleriaceae bacterium]|nr:tetratricopeptide repeat protein [Kofleriaceae bacterium]